MAGLAEAYSRIFKLIDRSALAPVERWGYQLSVFNAGTLTTDVFIRVAQRDDP